MCSEMYFKVVIWNDIHLSSTQKCTLLGKSKLNSCQRNGLTNLFWNRIVHVSDRRHVYKYFDVIVFGFPIIFTFFLLKWIDCLYQWWQSGKMRRNALPTMHNTKLNDRTVNESVDLMANLHRNRYLQFLCIFKSKEAISFCCV